MIQTQSTDIGRVAGRLREAADRLEEREAEVLGAVGELLAAPAAAEVV
jgi:hypothetical protein